MKDTIKRSRGTPVCDYHVITTSHSLISLKILIVFISAVEISWNYREFCLLELCKSQATSVVLPCFVCIMYFGKLMLLI